MKIVVTLGGNALLRRGEALSFENQRRNIEKACAALANLARNHELILSHGNGPQVGLIARQNEAYAAADPSVPPYPFDVLGAESQAMIGYMFTQALTNALRVRGIDKSIVSIVTRTEVRADDPAFLHPTKFIGGMMSKDEAQEAARLRGWIVKEDGKGWRRVVPSPKPLRIVEIEAVRQLAESGFVVISAGGGGAPVVRSPEGLAGTEAVIDKDYAGSILAAELKADRLIIATDVEGVFENWGTPDCRLIRETTPATLQSFGFSAGSMGPKVDAASQFVRATGKTAVIGRLEDIEKLVAGTAGTVILPD